MGISNTIIPNVYDYTKEPGLESYSCELRSKIGIKEDELFVLQPTRIVPRKWIERSIEIVHSLELPNPTLVISHASGDEGDDYHQRIIDYAENMGVKIFAIDNLIGGNLGNGKKKYSDFSYSCKWILILCVLLRRLEIYTVLSI